MDKCKGVLLAGGVGGGLWVSGSWYMAGQNNLQGELMEGIRWR